MACPTSVKKLVADWEVRFEDGVWKGPTVIPPEGYYKVGEKVLRIMRENAETVAQIDAATGIQDTYGSMADRCIRCALWLRKQGIRPGDVIGLYTFRHLDAFIPIVSSVMVGSIVSTWWPRDDSENLISKAALIKPKILFVESTHAQLIQKEFLKANMDIKLVCFQKLEGWTSFEEILAQQDSGEVARFQCAEIESPDTPAIMIFTSGTTDKAAKAVVLSYRTLGDADAFIPEKNTGNNCGVILPQMEWITAMNFNFGVLYAAATLVIYKGTAEADVNHDLFVLIEKYKINWIRMYTWDAEKFLEAMQQYDFSSVTYARFGGMVATNKLINNICKAFPNAQVHYTYGSTETGGNICGQIIGKTKILGSVGKVSKNIELKVVAENGKNVIIEPGQPGLISVKSPRQMIGYYNDSEATARAVDSDGWYRTGDYGYFDENGYIYVIDRFTDMINRKGVYVSSRDIENVIREVPGVLETAVVAKKCENTEVPTAFVVKEPDADVTEKDIVDWVKQNSSFEDVDDVRFLDALPKTGTGKVQKTVLRRIVCFD